MPCVIRVEKFEVLYNIATYLLLKVVGNLNNIQSYITKLLPLKNTQQHTLIIEGLRGKVVYPTSSKIAI